MTTPPPADPAEGPLTTAHNAAVAGRQRADFLLACIRENHHSSANIDLMLIELSIAFGGVADEIARAQATEQARRAEAERELAAVREACNAALEALHEGNPYAADMRTAYRVLTAALAAEPDREGSGG